MRNVLIAGVTALVVIAVSGLGGLALRDAQAAADDKPVLLINLTSGKEDLHAVTMGLQLAGHGLAAERDVVLFMNVRASELARKDLTPSLIFSDNPPVKQMLADLMAKGVHVYVCPACAKAIGVTEADIVPGAKMATRELLFGKLGPDAVVFTY